jgi:hypothetical protein
MWFHYYCCCFRIMQAIYVLVMWIYTEAKIWVWQKGFLMLPPGKTYHMQKYRVYLKLFSLYGSCCKRFITYKPAYARNFRVCFFTADQLMLFNWTISKCQLSASEEALRSLKAFIDTWQSSVLKFWQFLIEYCLSFVGENADFSHKLDLPVSPTNCNHMDWNLEI